MGKPALLVAALLLVAAGLSGQQSSKVRVSIEVLDKDGQVLKDGDRSGTVEVGKIDDDITVSTRMRTLDAPDAPKVRLRGEIIPK
jgi:hypothetical protein